MNHGRFTCVFFTCLFIVMLCATCCAETIFLRSGKRVVGNVIESTDSYIKVDISGVPVTYFRDMIASIDSSADPEGAHAVTGTQPALSGMSQPVGADGGSQNTDALIMHGIDLLMAQKHEEARAALAEALRLEPGNADAMHAMGCFLSLTGAYQDAVDYFEEVLKMKPHRTELYLALYGLYKTLQQEQKAESVLTRLLELRANDQQEFTMSAIRQFHLYLKTKSASIPR